MKSELRDKLTSMGHKFRVAGDYTTAMGRGQAVMHDSSSKVNYGGSDPRTDGSAEPEPPPDSARCSIAPGRWEKAK